MDNNIIYVIVAGLLALIFSFWKTSWIEKQDQGTKKMVVIGSSIADGAMAFLKAEYRVLSVFVVAVAIILGVGAAFMRRFISNFRKKFAVKS